MIQELESESSGLSSEEDIDAMIEPIAIDHGHSSTLNSITKPAVESEQNSLSLPPQEGSTALKPRSGSFGKPVTQRSKLSSSRSPSPAPTASPSAPRRIIRSRPLVTQKEHSLVKRMPGYEEREAMHEVDQVLEKRLLYVLIARCVVFPISKRPKIDRTPPIYKLNLTRFEELISRVKKFHTSEVPQSSVESDIISCIRDFHEILLGSPRIAQLVEDGNLSTAELKHMFYIFAKKRIESLQQNYQESDVPFDNPSPTLTSNPVDLANRWSAMVDKMCFEEEVAKDRGFAYRSSDDTFSQTELFSIFQQILGVSALDHQMFSTKCHLGDREEQESVLRRELQQWKEKFQRTENFKLDFAQNAPDIDSQYRQEMLRKVNELNSNLDSRIFNVTSAAASKPKKGEAHPDILASSIPRQEIRMNLDLRVTILEATGVKDLVGSKPFFITFETDYNSSYKTQIVKLSTDSDFVRFDAAQTFRVTSPLPELKLCLCTESSGLLSDSKTLAKNVVNPYPTAREPTKTIQLQATHQNVQTHPKIKLSIDFKRPAHVTRCGYLYCQGTSMFRTWKKRFFAIVQFSEYRFLLCHFKPKTSHPKQLLVLEGYVADVAEAVLPTGEPEIPQDGIWQFALVKDDSRYQFGTDREKDRWEWVIGLYRSTGQAQRPSKQSVSTEGGKEKAGMNQRETGLSEIATNRKVVYINHGLYYKKLLRYCMEYQMSRDEFNRGVLNQGIWYVLEEYSKRYLVRSIESNLATLEAYLEEEKKGHFINPAVIYLSLRNCSSITKGIANVTAKAVAIMDERLRQEKGFPVILSSELSRFKECCVRIEAIFSNKIKLFHLSMPFGVPKNDLMNAMTLVEFCLEISSVGDIPNNLIKEQVAQRLAGLMGETALTSYHEILGEKEVSSTEDLQTVADKCIEWSETLLTFYLDEFLKNPDQLKNIIESFWKLFFVDMSNVLASCKATDLTLSVFTRLNTFCSLNVHLRNCQFHHNLQEAFFPIVVQQFTDLHIKVAYQIQSTFKKETWTVSKPSVPAVTESVTLLSGLKKYVKELAWPNKERADHLNESCLSVCSEQLQDCAQRILFAFSENLKSFKASPSGELSPKLLAMLNGMWQLRIEGRNICPPSRPKSLDETKGPIYHKNIDEHIVESLNAALKALVEKIHEPIPELIKGFSNMGESGGISFFKKLTVSSWSSQTYLTYIDNLFSAMKFNLSSDVLRILLNKWYQTFWDIIDDWLRERIEVKLLPDQVQSMSTLLEVIPQMCKDQGLTEQELRGTEYTSVRERVNIESSITEST